MRRPSPTIVAVVFAALLGTILFSVIPALAAASLTITPITWNVVGLDSNDVTVGPNNFPVGARVCNTGDTAATNVTSTFVWDTADAFIDSRPGSKTSYVGGDAVASLAAGSCHDFYYEVQITRNSSAYDHTREYHITADADAPIVPISTSTPREIYVEFLISQSRNSTDDVKLDGVSVPAGGSMSLVVGGTYNIELIASTATNGYEQIESFINFPNTIFQVNSVAATYSANGGTDPDALTKLYADGCSWENDPNSPNYRSCLSTGKYGGDVTLDYNITVIGGGGTTQTLNTLIYDFSGSSYHYNADFSTSARIANIIDPTAMTISKSFAPDPTIVGGTSTLTFTIGNPNAAAISDVNFSDTFPTSPGAMVVANPTGASTTGCGTPTFAPVAGAGSISFSGGEVPANGNCLVSVTVTVPAVGTYNNTSGNLFVGTTDTGKNASDSLIVNTDPPPPSPVCGLTMAAWNFAGITDPIGSPAPSTQAADVGTAAITFGGTLPGPVIGVSDGASGNPIESVRMYGWQNAGPIVTATSPFIQFEIDTSNYTQVNLTFDLERKSNGPDSDELYYLDGTWMLKSAFSSTTSWASYGAYDFTGQTSTTGNTSFRLYGYGANTPSSGADLNIDNVSFTGCGVPNPPTIAKDFSPDPVAVSDTSTLSFTITNPNSTLALSGIAFSDTLPAGVTLATTGPTATCGGSLSTTSPDTVAFTGGSLAGGASCVIPVTVTVTTSGPHLNVSGFISATETGTNTGPGGSASDSITAISPPSISKLFNPNPILTGGTSTLTFSIINPNPDDQLTGIAFSDTFPTSPGSMVVANPTGASTTDCGSPTYTPVAAAGSISFTGGTIAAGGTCKVTVDVTATPTGDYANTSGAVSATTAGTGNTASDTLTVNPVNPDISILKQVGTSITGPWTTFVAVTTGSNIYYQMTVENIGDVALTGVNVTDPTLTGLSVDLSGCAWANMPLFDVQTCVVGPVTAVAGSHANTATSHGTYNSTEYDSSPSTATYATTGLTLAKSVAESFFTAAGETLNYSYLVGNNGSAPLAGPVVVSDDLSTDESCPDVSTVGDFDAFLDPGESITCTATYTTTAGDVTAGSVTNTASATVDGVTSNQDDETVLINLPDMQVTKANNTSDSTPVGVAYNWTITLSNAGPVAAAFADGEVILRDPLPNGPVPSAPTYGAVSVGSVTNVTNSGNISCSIDGSSVLTCDASGATVTIGATTGTFTVTVPATPTGAGDLANTATVDPDLVINEGDETNNEDSDTVTAVGPPSIAKIFSPDSIAVGATSSLQFTISNANTGTALTGVAFTDTLPAGATVASATTFECGGTLTVTAPSSIALSGGSIAASSNCVFSVTVTGATAGSKANTTGTVTSTNGGDGNTASDTLTVISPPSIAKVFSPDSIAVGATSSLQFTITNANAGTALTGVAFTDVLPSGVTVASATTSECGGTLTVTAPSSIALSGGSIAASSNCAFSVTVTGATAGSKVNTSGNVSSTNGGTGNTATDTLTVIGGPSIAKTFSPDSIAVGATSSLQFTISNANTGTTLTGVAFSDALPAGVTVTSATTSECGGTLTVTAPSSIALSGGSIAASSNCVFSVTVTGATAGSKVNTTGTVTSTNGGDGNTATDTLTVISPPSIAKTFTPDSITVGNTSSLQFTITNSNAGTALTGVAFTDSLPAGVTVTSATTSECGGTLTVTAPGSIALSGGSIASSANCVFSVTVTGATVGVKVNTTGTVSSTNGGTGNSATDTLTVSAPIITDPAVTKSVSPSTAAIGDTVTFTLFVSNGGPGDALDVELVDTIPAFLEITLVATVPSPVSTLISGNTVTIDFGTVTPSDTYTVTITTVVRDSATPQIGTNTADISTSSPESDTGNNSDSVPITIVVASPPLEAPETGFAPNRRTSLPMQPAAKAYETYGELRLEIAALGVEMSIVGIPQESEGWDVTWLADQAGYLAGTAFPTWRGNSVITGHNTLASGINGPFAQLEDLEYGDQIVITAWGMRHIYEVREEDWVRPTDSSIFRHEERPWVTLLTCDDWDERTETYRMRHLVRAVLTNIEQEDSETPKE